jgi:hypothetical protein
MATVTASYNWVSGETVTPTKLNTTAAPTVVVADNEVTTAKILDATSTTTGVTNSKLRHSAALSVIGRSADSAGAPADIAAANDGEVFRRSGTAVGFGTVATAGIANAAVTPAKLSQPLTLDTAKAATSGTSIDFTGIPSWAKRITVMLEGVSTNGSSALTLRVGTTSGFVDGAGSYVGSSDNMQSGVTPNNFSTGFNLEDATMSSTHVRHYVCTLLNFSGNRWMFSVVGGLSGTAAVTLGGGSISLAAVLDRVRLTTLNGTDAFDAGSVNIMYEG